MLWTLVFFGHPWLSIPSLRYPLLISAQAPYLPAIINTWRIHSPVCILVLMTGGSRDWGSHFGMQLNKKHLLQPSSSPVRIAYKLKGPGSIVWICRRPLLSTAWCVMGTLQRIKQWNQGTCYLVDCILSGLIVQCQRFQELQNSEKFRPTARPQCKALNAKEFDLDVL